MKSRTFCEIDVSYLKYLLYIWKEYSKYITNYLIGGVPIKECNLATDCDGWGLGLGGKYSICYNNKCMVPKNQEDRERIILYPENIPLIRGKISNQRRRKLYWHNCNM